MEFSAQNVEYAVSVFYNGEPTDQARAHTWLTGAQRVPDAWSFVWELLQPTKGTEVQFYGATTLHTKILRCWNEVPPESYDQLQEKLLQAVFLYSKGPKIVTNRLCISLAAFILQKGSEDLAAILRPLSCEENTSLLLEVLTVLPQEYNSVTMVSPLRSKNRAALRAACPAVLDDMLRYLQSVYNDYSKAPPSEETIVSWSRAAYCTKSWLRIDGQDANYGPSLPERMPLCRALLTAVHVLYTCNQTVSGVALEACEACLSGARTVGVAGDAYKYPTAALQLLGSLAGLVAPVMARDDVPHSPNEDLLSAMITCCVVVACTHVRAFVECIEENEPLDQAAAARQLLQIMLATQAAPGYYPIHETRSKLLFGFWYTLQDEILNVMEDKREVNSVWREAFSQLLTVLVVKSEAPVGLVMTKDDLELLRCYRQDIADSLMYCYAVLGEWCWTTVENTFTEASHEERREAALHVFLALADAAPHQRAPAPLLAMLHHAVAQVNTSLDMRTVNTALDCLGSYASWVSSLRGESGTEVGVACVRAAGGALSRSPAAAALALRKLCAECAAPAALLAPDIMLALQKCQGEDLWTRRQLLGAAGAALSAAEPQVARALLQDVAETLRADLVLQAQNPTVSSGAADCAAALLAALTSRSKLCGELYRVLGPALPPFALHPNLVEPMFNILKEVVSTMMGEVITFVGPIAELSIAGFKTAPCAPGLDFVKLIVLVVGNEWLGAKDVLRSGVTGAARQVARDPPSRADLTEALFQLLAAVTKKRPIYFEWIKDVVKQLLDLACSCIGMWESGAARAACSWVAALAAARPGDLLSHAPQLTAVALTCIGGATPRNQIEPLADVLLAMNRALWPGGELSTWLRASLRPAGFPTPHATNTQKLNFIAALVKEKSSKRRVLETVQEFSLICRGLVGTEYARQSIEAKQLVS